MIQLAPRADGGEVYLDDNDNVVSIRPLHPHAAKAAKVKSQHKPRMLREKHEEIVKDLNTGFAIARNSWEMELMKFMSIFFKVRAEIKEIDELVRYAHNNARAGNIEATTKYLAEIRRLMGS